MPSPSAISAVSPSRPLASGLPGRLAVGLAATVFVALAAHVALPLPFTPVPFTLQPLAVLVVGLLLGPLDGALVLLAYLAEGAAGLPVFSPTGPGGWAQLVGFTGGFLLAYPLVAFLAGLLTQQLKAAFGPFLAALTGGSVATSVLFLSGASWLLYLKPMPLHAVWIAAVAPFLPGEAVKVLAAAGVYRALQTNRAQ